jgi:ferritin-like metal-binding protein YciE
VASIETPNELFVHKLGAALTMEETILGMLQELQEHAQDSKLRRNLQQHHQETVQQVDNLRRIFQALGEQPVAQPSLAIEGLEKDGKEMLKQVDGELVDSVILGGVIETEHHEIAVYDGLIIKAEAMGDDDIVALLQENLEQEEGALDKAVKGAEQSSKQLALR